MVTYTPRSNALLRVEGVLHMILEIVSNHGESDCYRMLLQAACLARLGNALRQNPSSPFIVTAIYVHSDFRATQYLVYQPDISNKQVFYTATDFALNDASQAFEFVFQLYNLAAQARQQSQDILIPRDRIQQVACEIEDKSYPVITSHKRKHCDDNAEEGSTKRKRRRGGSEGDRSQLDESIIQAGYTVTVTSDMGPLRSLLTLPRKMRKGMTPDGSRVIFKPVDDQSIEVENLEYLKKLGGPAHHIIELLDVLQQDKGKIIVLPQYTPLPLALPLYRDEVTVTSLLQQFLEGVAFMHRHQLAHLDLKPDNVVVVLCERPTVFIIDLDCSVKVDGIKTMIYEKCGTRGWIAPEVIVAESYSPILADRWACGKMIRYFGQRTTLATWMEELSHRLMDDNPDSRPPVFTAGRPGI
ncbi:kinase-like domain-containing protein [Gautieria morchelliformis]|nr:kinase-like domain-containing protein [Gautieria morchelliformis]